MPSKVLPSDIVDAIRALAQEGVPSVSSTDVYSRVGGSAATVGRLLRDLVRTGVLKRQGAARATRYSTAGSLSGSRKDFRDERGTATAASPAWSTDARRVFRQLDRPLGVRQPVTYQRSFVDRYVPNRSSLLPRAMADALAHEGRMAGQQPAGTYARKVLEQLLIDLSWSSSRLEGNPYSLIATETLFRSGETPTDQHGVMLLNHKRAIEFLVDAVPGYGLTDGVIRNLHALLMQDLLTGPQHLGAVRTKVVNISDTTYIPWQVPQLLQEMLTAIIDKAQHVKNPVEAAFFLWTNLAYLQPFEDGNKRTSRLAANVPLLLYNSAPLAFLDVDPGDHARAMLAIYEMRDVTIASELFAWTYRRSIERYRVILEAMGSPDEFRVRHREHLTEAMQRIVRQGQSIKRAMSGIDVPEEETSAFRKMLIGELDTLTPYNCARYRITMSEAHAWIRRRKERPAR